MASNKDAERKARVAQMALEMYKRNKTNPVSTAGIDWQQEEDRDARVAKRALDMHLSRSNQRQAVTEPVQEPEQIMEPVQEPSSLLEPTLTREERPFYAQSTWGDYIEEQEQLARREAMDRLLGNGIRPPSSHVPSISETRQENATQAALGALKGAKAPDLLRTAMANRNVPAAQESTPEQDPIAEYRRQQRTVNPWAEQEALALEMAGNDPESQAAVQAMFDARLDDLYATYPVSELLGQDVLEWKRSEISKRTNPKGYLGQNHKDSWSFIDQLVMEGGEMTQAEADIIQAEYDKAHRSFWQKAKDEAADLLTNAYDFTIGNLTGNYVHELQAEDEANNAQGVGAGEFLKGLGYNVGGSFNDFLLGLGENYNDATNELMKLVGVNGANLFTGARERNAQNWAAGTAEVQRNATWGQRMLFDTASSAANSYAMAFMGQGLGVAANNMMGGGNFAVNPVLTQNRIANVVNATQMAPFALQSASEAYDAAEEQGLSGWQRSASAITAMLMSYASNSQAYEDYMERVGLGVAGNAEMMARNAASRSMTMSERAYAWLSDTLTGMSTAEGVQEVTESLTLKLNADMWAGTFFDVERWNEWSQQAREDFVGGYLSGAVFNAATLPSYFTSNQMYQQMMSGEMETNADNLAELIVQAGRDAQSAEGQAALAEAAEQAQTQQIAEPEPVGADPLREAANAYVEREEAESATEPDAYLYEEYGQRNETHAAERPEPVQEARQQPQVAQQTEQAEVRGGNYAETLEQRFGRGRRRVTSDVQQRVRQMMADAEARASASPYSGSDLSANPYVSSRTEETTEQAQPEAVRETQQPAQQEQRETENEQERTSSTGTQMFRAQQSATVTDEYGDEHRVTVVGVESVEDGIPVLRVVNEQGEDDYYTSDDLNFDGEYAELMAYEGTARMDAKGLRNYLEGYDSKWATPEQYARAYNAVYQRAVSGQDYETAAKQSDALNYLSGRAATSAYSAGLNVYNQKHNTVQAAEVKNEAGVHVADGNASLSAQERAQEGKKRGKISKRYSQDAFAKLGKDGRKNAIAQMELLAAMASRTGHTIAVVDRIVDKSGNSANASYDPKTREIQVSLDTIGGAYTYAAMHELTHAMKNERSQTEWNDFVSFVKEALTKNGQSWDELVQYQMDRFGYNRAQAEEEVVCNTAPAMLQDESNVLKLYKGNRTLFERVVDWVRGLLKDIKTAGDVLSKRSQSWSQMDALKNDRQTLHEMYERMMAILESDAQDSKSGKNGEIKTSFRDVRTDSPAFKRWFGNSQIVNEDGSPMVVYHGTATEFWTFDKKKANDMLGRRMGLGAGKGKFYLTEHKGSGNAAAYSAQGTGKGNQPKVMELYVSAQKVMDRSEYERRLKTEFAKYPNSDPRGEAYDYKQRDKAIAALDKQIRKEGYDGVWDRDGGELFVYEPNQIKSATDNVGTFDPNNPDIRFSMNDTVEETRDMLAVHNLTEENMRNAMELGGLAMPSIAVIKSEQGHSQYGTISVIFDKNTIDPQASRDNEIYGGDAWTPTFPHVEYEVDEEVESRIREKYRKLRTKLGESMARSLYSYGNDLQHKIDSAGSVESMVNNLLNDTNMMQLYLADTGKETVDPVVKRSVTRMEQKQIDETEMLVKALGAEAIRSYRPTDSKRWMEKYGDTLAQAYEDALANVYGFDPEDIQIIMDDPARTDAKKALRNAYRYLRDGAEKVTEETDYEATANAIRDAVDEKDYKAWLNDMFAGAVKGKGIRNDAGMFTPSGKRRSFKQTHWEVTLENVVRAMRKQEKTGVGTLGRSIEGAAVKKYKSIADVKADSGRLGKVDNDQYNAMRKDFINRFTELVEWYSGGKSWTDAGDVLVEAVTKYQDAAGILKYMNQFKDYYKPNQNVAEDLAQLVDEMKNAPTGYFEAKPRRAVGFEEMAAVIVPDNLSDDVRTNLENAGVNVIEYKAGDEADRLAKMNSADVDRLKFSMRDTDENVQDALNAQQKAFEQVKGHRITAAEADKLAGIILKKANSDYDQQTLAAEVSRIYDYVERGEDVDWNQVDDEMTSLMSRVMEKSKTLNLEHEEMAKPIRDYLRKTRIRLTDEQRAEAANKAGSYEAYRKGIFGRVRLTSAGGTTLDSVWQELNAMNSELFPGDASEGDQVMLLMDAVDALKPVYETGMGMSVEETASWLAGRMNEAYFDLPAVKAAAQSARTFGDSILALKNAIKRFEESGLLEYQNALRSLREAKGQQQRTQYQQKVAALRKKYKKWREKDTAKRKERELKAKYRQKIERTAQTLTNWLNKPTDAKHVPDGVADSVRRMLASLDFSGKSTKTARELCDQLNGLADALLHAQEGEDENSTIFLERDQQMIDEIKRVAELIRGNTDHQQSEGRGVYDLSGMELRELTNWLNKLTDSEHVPAGVEDSVRRMLASLDFSGKSTKTANELYDQLNGLADALLHAQEGEDENRTIFLKRDQQMIDEIKRVAELIRGNIDNQQSEGRGVYDLNGMELRELSKWLDVVKHVITEAGKMRGSNLPGDSVEQVAAMSMVEIRRKKPQKDKKWITKEWNKRFGVDMQDSFTFFEHLGSTSNAVFKGLRQGFDKMAGLVAEAEKHTKTILKGANLKQMTGKHAKKHSFQLKSGKVELTKAQIMEMYVLSKREQAQGHLYGGGFRLQGDENARPYTISKAELTAITDTLTKDEKRIADGMQKFLSKECANWGNQTSMKLLGYRKFTEQYYWPISTDPNSRNTTKLEDNFGANINSIKNQGMTKQTIDGAKNAIVIGDIFDTYTRHISNMSAYSAYALPLSDFTRWYNSRGVKTEIEHALGKDGLKYINNFLMAVNGSSVQQEKSGMSKAAGVLTRNAKVASVGANARVVIQQPTSYARAAMYMSPKYLSEALVMRKPDEDLVNKYCPIAQWKRWGFYETNVGPSLRQLVVGDTSAADKVREIAMKPASMGDDWTLNHLWNACEMETRDVYPELERGSEKYYKQVGARMSEIIDRTQVVDSVFHRSQMMRSKNVMDQMLTNFMAEPTKTYNMLMGAISDYADNRRNKAARNRLARAFVVYGVTGVMTAAAAGVIDAFRDDDEEKDWVEKYMAAVLGDYSETETPLDYAKAAILESNVSSNLNPLGMLPGVNDVLSLLQGYEANRLDQQSIQRIIWAAQEVQKYVNGESKQNLYGVSYKVAQALSSVLGIPASNVMRDINAVIQTVTGDSPTLNPTARKSGTVAKLYSAMAEGKKADAQKLRAELRTKAGMTDKQIDTALAERLMEDPKVIEAWTAKAERRFADANRAHNALTAKGFSSETVDKAIELYGKSVTPKETKEKDPDEQLKVTLYSNEDVASAIRILAGVEQGGSVTEADVHAMISERVAGSSAQDPEKSVKSSIQSELKKSYLAMEKSGDTAGMRKLEMVMKDVMGTTQETMESWVKDQHADNLRAAVDSYDSNAARKAVAVMRRDGKTDSQIKSSLSGYKDRYIEAMRSGDRATAGKIKTFLKSLGLTGKNGQALYTDQTFADWLN